MVDRFIFYKIPRGMYNRINSGYIDSPDLKKRSAIIIVKDEEAVYAGIGGKNLSKFAIFIDNEFEAVGENCIPNRIYFIRKDDYRIFLITKEGKVLMDPTLEFHRCLKNIIESSDNN